MPGFITHHLFGQHIYRSLAAEPIGTLIRKYPRVYGLGLQGPDIFFFYLPGYFHKHKKNIGSIMHVTNTGKFFSLFLEEINKLAPNEREVAVVYLAGFLCHYFLDVNTHPFIYSMTHYQSNDKNTDCYYAEHRTFEAHLDAVLLYASRKQFPSSFSKAGKIELSSSQRQSLLPLVAKAINRTYSQTPNASYITPHYMNRVYLASQLFCRALYDPLHYKKRLLQNAEKYLRLPPYFSSLLTADSDIYKTSCLNHENKSWTLGWFPYSTHNNSFKSLYRQAFSGTLTTLLLLSEYFICKGDSGQIRKQLLKQIGNADYHTGQKSG